MPSALTSINCRDYMQPIRSLPFLAVLLAGALHAPAPALAASVHITEAWAPPSLKGVKNGVAFVTIANDADQPDTLTGAETPSAASAELHTHEMQGDVMQMRAVKSITIPANETVAMQPGGLHIMLLQLNHELKEGDTVPLILHFEHTGDIKTEAKVRAHDVEPAHGHSMHGM